MIAIVAMVGDMRSVSSLGSSAVEGPISADSRVRVICFIVRRLRSFIPI